MSDFRFHENAATHVRHTSQKCGVLQLAQMPTASDFSTTPILDDTELRNCIENRAAISSFITLNAVIRRHRIDQNDRRETRILLQTTLIPTSPNNWHGARTFHRRILLGLISTATRPADLDATRFRHIDGLFDANSQRLRLSVRG